MLGEHETNSSPTATTMLYCFGDSHVGHCFDRIRSASVCWLGPVTMHRVARDGLWFLDQIDVRPNTTVLLLFGEIDVRCHLGRVADETNTSRSDVAHSLVQSYVGRIAAARSGVDGVRFVLCSVPPPADGPGIQNSDFPVYGNHGDRARLTSLVNSELRTQCKTHAFDYLDFHEEFATPEGYLIEGLSDGSVHIDRRYTLPIVRRLERLLATSLLLEEPDPRIST